MWWWRGACGAWGRACAGCTAAGVAAGVGVAASAATAGSALINAGTSESNASTSANASEQAANLQFAAATNAQNNTKNTQIIQQNSVDPYEGAGQTAEEMLEDETGLANPAFNPLTAPYQSWNPTEAGLESTPGYQFTQQQGLESTQNSFAAQGLASSGAALKGAASYATGLADSTYNQQYQNYLQGQQSYLAQNQQIYNMLGGIAGSGQNAALGIGSLNLNAIGQENTLATSGAASQAAGVVGAANATTTGNSQAASAIGSGLSNAALYSGLGNTNTTNNQTSLLSGGPGYTQGGQTNQSGYVPVGGSTAASNSEYQDD